MVCIARVTIVSELWLDDVQLLFATKNDEINIGNAERGCCIHQKQSRRRHRHTMAKTSKSRLQNDMTVYLAADAS